MDGDPHAQHPFESGSIALLHRRRARVLGWSAVALFAYFDLAGRLGRGPAAWLPLLCVLLAATAWHLARRGTHGAGELSVGRDTLTVTVAGRAHSIALAALRQGWYAADHVHLELHNGDRLRVAVGARARAEELLAALRLDAAHRALAVPIAGRSPAAVGVLAYLAAAFGVVPTLVTLARAAGLDPSATGWLARYALLGTIWAALRVVGRGHAVVGTDGVAVRPRVGAPSFVPLGAVAAVRVENDDVLLVRNDGGAPVRLATRSPASADREALETRLHAARAVADAAAAPANGALALLDRRGRSLAEWRAALRQLLRGADGYRAVAVQPDELLRALEDPRSPPERRVAAALALADRHDAPTRTRIRAAAETSAAPDLRVALRAIADDGDAGDAHAAVIERAVGARGAAE